MPCSEDEREAPSGSPGVWCLTGRAPWRSWRRPPYFRAQPPASMLPSVCGMSCRGTLQGTSLESPRLPCSPVPGPRTTGKAGCGAPCGVTMWCRWHVLETKGTGTRAATMRHGRPPNMRSTCHGLTGSRGLVVPWGPSPPGRGSCWRWPPAHPLLGVGVSALSVSPSQQSWLLSSPLGG